MLITFESDQVNIPRLRAEQEAVMQELRGALAQPRTLALNGSGRLAPIAEQQMPTQVTRAEIVPFRKRDEPAKRTSPTPPHRPAPAQPYRHAAQSQDEQALDTMKFALAKGVAIASKGDPLRRPAAVISAELTRKIYERMAAKLNERTGGKFGDELLKLIL